MVFKPSFKCFKNEKVNFIQAFPKLETLLFQNIFYIISSYSIFIERFRLKKKEKCTGSLKNMPYKKSLFAFFK